MNCNKCGYSGSPDARFCIACGATIEQAQAVIQQSAAQEADSPQVCGACNGRGLDALMQSCQKCGGTGRAFMQQSDVFGAQSSSSFGGGNQSANNWSNNNQSPNNWGEANSQWGNQGSNNNSPFYQPSQQPQTPAKPVTAGLILGIVGIVLCILNFWIPVVHLVGLAFGIAATALGVRGNAVKAPLAPGSLAVGIIAIVLAGLMFSLGFVFGCINALI